MNEGKQTLSQRFPEFAQQIRKLSGNNLNFDALCSDLEQAKDGLARLEGSVEPDAEIRAETLRLRCADLEQELLAIMQQNIRV